MAALAAALVFHWWAWRRQMLRISRGLSTPWQGALRFAGWATGPPAVVCAALAVGIGIETLWRVPVLPERAILLVLPVLALSVVAVVTVVIRAAWLAWENKKIPTR